MTKSEETRVVARVPAELAEKAKRAAKLADTTLSQEIRRSLRELVAEFPEKPVPELLRDEPEE